MGCQTKVQLIKRQNSRQWYVNFPAQLARALELKAGEVVEWEIEDRTLLALIRTEVPEGTLKKKRAPLANLWKDSSCSRAERMDFFQA
jgi:antitoxin component of MazEF toxin-antitoxin module